AFFSDFHVRREKLVSREILFAWSDGGSQNSARDAPLNSCEFSYNSHLEQILRSGYRPGRSAAGLGFANRGRREESLCEIPLNPSWVLPNNTVVVNVSIPCPPPDEPIMVPSRRWLLRALASLPFLGGLLLMRAPVVVSAEDEPAAKVTPD